MKQNIDYKLFLWNDLTVSLSTAVPRISDIVRRKEEQNLTA